MINIGECLFYEKINLVKLNYILKNKEKYKDQIEEEEIAMRRKNRKDKDSKSNVWTNIKKIIKNTKPIPNSEYGYIEVSYKKGVNSNNIGRWYANNSIGLAPLCTCIRHTICDKLWVDIDQINSHPSITKTFMEKQGYNSPLLNKCFEDRENFLKTIMEEEKITRDEAKTAVISVINGGKYKTKTLKQLADELRPCINNVIELPEYKNIYEYCKKNYRDNVIGKTFSRILQVVENDLLERYLEYSIDNGLVPIYKNHHQAVLIFDGFQLPYDDKITQELLDDMRKYAFEKVGYDIPLKIKPFDNKLDIPDDYNEIDEEDDEDDEEEEEEQIGDNVRSYGDVKEEFEKTTFKILFPPSIYSINSSNNGDIIQSVKNAKDTYAHLNCYTTTFMKKKKKIVALKKETLFFNKWLVDSNIKRYDGIEWKPPPLICEDNYYNSWKPLEISNVKLQKSNRNYYKEFLTFAGNLFENKETTDYILSRYAFRLQNLGLRSNVCVVYHGEEGTGKSTFLETIYNLFGKGAIQIDKAKKLYESHSTFEKEKYFICVNEAGGVDNFENSEVLKTRITEPTLNINPKGIQAYQIDNICDYDMTTNNINVIKLTDSSERRWFQTSVTNHYLGDMEFFDDYRKNILNNTNALKQIYEGLMKYDWKDVIKSGNFQDVNYKPKNNITNQVKECNRDKILYFFRDLLDDTDTDTDEEDENPKQDDEELKIHNKHLFRRWIDWCYSNKVNIEMNNIQFGIRVRQLSNKIKSKTKKDFIVNKNTKGENTINKGVFREYYNLLDN